MNPPQLPSARRSRPGRRNPAPSPGSTWTEARSCIGSKSNRPLTYMPGATLAACIEVGPSRTQIINVPPVITTVGAALTGALDNATYCDDISRPTG